MLLYYYTPHALRLTNLLPPLLAVELTLGLWGVYSLREKSSLSSTFEGGVVFVGLLSCLASR